MQSASEASFLLRCQMGIIELTTSSFVTVRTPIFWIPASSTSPVSYFSVVSTSVRIGQRT